MMDKVIYKYDMNPGEDGVTLLKMPGAAILLDVQPQPGQGLQLWALVDKLQPPETRKFKFYNTGEKLPPYPGEHVKTIQAFELAMSGPSPIVMHIFEVPNHGTN